MLLMIAQQDIPSALAWSHYFRTESGLEPIQLSGQGKIHQIHLDSFVSVLTSKEATGKLGRNFFTRACSDRMKYWPQTERRLA